MSMKIKKQLLICALILAIVGSFYIGKSIQPTLEKSLQVILSHQKNWRQQVYATGEMTPPLYIGLFKSRPTGATATIVCHDLHNKEEPYVLITRQMRKDTDSVLKEFFENPAGFYNGAYDEKRVPHAVTEDMERFIENQGDDAYQNRGKLYEKALQSYDPSAAHQYTLDSDLLSTALRETREETGVDLLPFLDDKNTKIIDLEPLDTQVAYVRNVLIHITSDQRPLTKIDGAEVIWAGWVHINDFSDKGLTVSIDSKQYHFKPSPWLKERFTKVIQSLQQDR